MGRKEKMEGERSEEGDGGETGRDGREQRVERRDGMEDGGCRLRSGRESRGWRGERVGGRGMEGWLHQEGKRGERGRTEMERAVDGWGRCLLNTNTLRF